MTETVFEAATSSRRQPRLPSGNRRLPEIDIPHPTSSSQRSTSNSRLPAGHQLPRKVYRVFISSHLALRVVTSFFNVGFRLQTFVTYNVFIPFCASYGVSTYYNSLCYRYVTFFKITYLQFVVWCYTLFGLRWKWNVRRVSTVNAMKNFTHRSFVYVSVIQEIDNMMEHMARYNCDRQDTRAAACEIASRVVGLSPRKSSLSAAQRWPINSSYTAPSRGRYISLFGSTANELSSDASPPLITTTETQRSSMSCFYTVS